MKIRSDNSISKKSETNCEIIRNKNTIDFEDTRISSYDYVYLYDYNGRISFSSFGGARALGLKPNEVVGKTWNELGVKPDVVNVFNLQLEVVFKTGRPLIGENKFPSIYGEKDYEYIMHPIYNGDGNIVNVECIFKDITIRKQTEIELRRKMMRYNIEDGKVYIVEESQSFEPINVFEKLLKFGYIGLVITRNTEKDFKKIEIDEDFKFYWLTESREDKTLPPIFKKVLSLIKDQIRKTVVLIERIDYLIFKNGYKKTINFIKSLKEIAAINGIVIIISYDQSILTEQENILFKTELNELETRFNNEKISKKLIEIINKVHQTNSNGSKSSYTSISKQLGISKPTVRKRVRKLVSEGYLFEIEKGRNKLVDLTELGWNLMTG
jgi:PAS domain S-box-containing protein